MSETPTWYTPDVVSVQVKLLSETLTPLMGNGCFAIDFSGATASTHFASDILKSYCNSKPSVCMQLSSTGNTYNSLCFFFKSILVHYMKLKTSVTFKNHHKVFSEWCVFPYGEADCNLSLLKSPHPDSILRVLSNKALQLRAPRSQSWLWSLCVTQKSMYP